MTYRKIEKDGVDLILDHEDGKCYVLYESLLENLPLNTLNSSVIESSVLHTAAIRYGGPIPTDPNHPDHAEAPNPE